MAGNNREDIQHILTAAEDAMSTFAPCDWDGEDIPGEEGRLLREVQSACAALIGHYRDAGWDRPFAHRTWVLNTPVSEVKDDVDSISEEEFTTWINRNSMR